MSPLASRATDAQRTAIASRKTKTRIRIPDEILFLIIDACTPRFNILIYRDAIKTRYTGLSYQSKPGPIKIHGVPDLSYLKLVNRRFHEQVWPVLCANFSGRLLLEDRSDSNAEKVIDWVNKLFTDQLKYFAHYVTEMRDWMSNVNAYSGLNIDLFTQLKTIHLEVSMWDEDADFFAFNTSTDALEGELDDQVIAWINGNLTQHSQVRLLLESLRDKSVNIVFVRLFQFDLDYSSVFFYADFTKAESPSIIRRARSFGEDDSDDSENDL